MHKRIGNELKKLTW